VSNTILIKSVIKKMILINFVTNTMNKKFTLIFDQLKDVFDGDGSSGLVNASGPHDSHVVKLVDQIGLKTNKKSS
jgi:hypothetical protein